MTIRIALVILTSLLAFGYSARNANRLRFRYGTTTVNFPLTVEVFDSKGLKVSIPHKDGLEMFSFHGKVNSPFISSDTRGDGGTLAHDVLGSIDGHWVYENTDIKLQIGDVLNFWVFLQYKGAGQRFNDLSHVVKKLTPTALTQNIESFSISQNIDIESSWHTTPSQTKNHILSASTTPLPIIYTRPVASNYADHSAPNIISQQQCECNDNVLKDVWAQMNATVAKMQMLEANIVPLEEKLSSLTETVVELIKNMDIGTKLLLTGNLPLRTNPVEDVRHLIVEKLKLFDLSMTILQAEYKSNGIAFEVSSSVDKLRILKRSNDILSKLSYQIIDPERPVFDVRSAR